MTTHFESSLTWDCLSARLSGTGLWPVGGFHAERGDDLPKGTATLVLLAPDDAAFWPLFTASTEYADGCGDPLDRWSRRVIGGIACELGAKAIFPFTGPPWRPFIAWAVRTGRIHQSPVGLLIEQRAGLFVSLRGALALKTHLDLPAPVPAPCDSCEGHPCLTACPVGALGQDGYDTQACRGYLKTNAGAACMGEGCAVRRACPTSKGWPRQPAQSAFHMRAFQG